MKSGTVSIEIGDVPMAGLKQHMERTFRQLASEKGLAFNVEFDDSLPPSIRTDEKRLQQIVLNLLSNAFKFTAHGGVTLSARTATEGWSPTHPILRDSEQVIEISVSDTGIGIPARQAEADLRSRSIRPTAPPAANMAVPAWGSRSAARLRACWEANSRCGRFPGEGSTFTLYVPIQSLGVPIAIPAMDMATGETPPTPAVTYALPDDRDELNGKPFVLIVEDDATFAGILLELAHDQGLKGVISSAGSGTVAMVRKLRPNAITLDLGLSDIDGFVLLDLLRHDPDTADIPVHVISGAEQAEHALTIGATRVIDKPADRDQLADLFNSIAKSARASKKGKSPARRAGRSTQARDDP